MEKTETGVVAPDLAGLDGVSWNTPAATRRYFEHVLKQQDWTPETLWKELTMHRDILWKRIWGYEENILEALDETIELLKEADELGFTESSLRETAVNLLHKVYDQFNKDEFWVAIGKQARGVEGGRGVADDDLDLAANTARNNGRPVGLETLFLLF